MRLQEILESVNPYRKTNLPLSNYRGLSNPLDDDEPYGDEFDSATELWDIVDDKLEAGEKPRVVQIRVRTLLATQDWLSTEPGDGPMWDEYGDKPVVLDYEGKRYILDGHNRIARAAKAGRYAIEVYFFG